MELPRACAFSHCVCLGPDWTAASVLWYVRPTGWEWCCFWYSPTLCRTCLDFKLLWGHSIPFGPALTSILVSFGVRISSDADWWGPQMRVFMGSYGVSRGLSFVSGCRQAQASGFALHLGGDDVVVRDLTRLPICRRRTWDF